MNLNEQCLLQFLVNPLGNFIEEEKILSMINTSNEKFSLNNYEFREIFVY